MDRICLSVAIMPMAAEFGWPASLQGVIQSAFLWGYMATQLVGGALADRYGGKRVLAAGIAWFSVASLLLPVMLQPATVAAGLTVPAVLLSRFLTGLGEGVALPSMSNLVASHIEPAAKARALGLCFSGFHSGNLVGLVLSPLLLMTYGWRGLFMVFGVLGLPLLLFWLRAVPDVPAAAAAAAGPGAPAPEAAKPAAPAAPAAAARAAAPNSPPGTSMSAINVSINYASTSIPVTEQAAAGLVASNAASAAAAADAAAGPGPSSAAAAAAATPAAAAAAAAPAAKKSDVTVAKLLTSSATWAIIVVNVVNHFGYFIYLNWMPTYFSKALGFDLRSSSFTAFLPWLVMAVGSSASGLLADSLVARGVPVTTVRKSLQTVAFLVPAAALMVLCQPGISAATAVSAMTVALGTTSLGQAGFVANMSDVAPRHAGKMFGLCNTFGCLSGIVGVTAVGFIVEATKSFTPVFQMTAALYVLGVAVWLVWCRGEKVFD
ncbi:hypothetical protein HXX76_002565 [Chlamydomonas incerta]|uniref:Major facilitator superfamily (MFS) profile domain-containing protein n=1 Tax=Chlamydomonas incerta TaxID=51695 RepID=A0A835TBP8_CHLIN|nr:hypothetical protein HXX76_002565 [Chlamydomonas incerta]|eukprot:KAG2442479.1 hypothetical protein HXX76_002565 [Chlamydomonas incerta]